MKWSVPGQATAKRLLDAALQRGTVHAFLLTGPSGLGKGALAREAARRLLCAGDDPLGECRSCRLVAAAAHPDFIQMEPEGEQWRIGEIRRIGEIVSRRPALGERRVVILNDIKGLTAEAANAFLKLLEEPPPGHYFFLLAAAAGRLPLTIRSRCLWLGLRPVPRTELVATLRERGIPNQVAQALAERSGGNPGRALALWEAGMPDSGAEIFKILRQDPLGPLKLAETWAEKGEEGLAELSELWRAERQRVAMSPAVWVAVEREILKARERLSSRDRRELVWENLFLAWRRKWGESEHAQGDRG